MFDNDVQCGIVTDQKIWHVTHSKDHYRRH